MGVRSRPFSVQAFLAKRDPTCGSTARVRAAGILLRVSWTVWVISGDLEDEVEGLEGRQSLGERKLSGAATLSGPSPTALSSPVGRGPMKIGRFCLVCVMGISRNTAEWKQDRRYAPCGA